MWGDFPLILNAKHTIVFPFSLARVQEKYGRYESSIHFMFVTTQRYIVDLFEPLESQKQASFVCRYSVFAHFESHEQKKFMNVFCFFVFFEFYEFRFI